MLGRAFKLIFVSSVVSSVFYTISYACGMSPDGLATIVYPNIDSGYSLIRERLDLSS